MRIALDWDDTFTRDPKLWAGFVYAARLRGHDVRIVTFRSPEQVGEIQGVLNGFHLTTRVMATDMVQKRQFCNQAGWIPDVWIDDSPEFIV